MNPLQIDRGNITDKSSRHSTNVYVASINNIRHTHDTIEKNNRDNQLQELNVINRINGGIQVKLLQDYWEVIMSFTSYSTIGI